MDQQQPPPVQPPVSNTASQQPANIPPIQQTQAQTPAPPPSGNQPVQPPPPASPTNSAQMQMPTHTKRKLLVIIIISLIVIVVVVAAYFLFMNKPAPTAKTTKPVVVTVSPTPTPDPTANWETFIVDEENFSFKYPPGGKISGQGPISDIQNIRIGEVASVVYNNIDISVSVSSPIAPTPTPIKVSTESATIKGVVWNIEFSPKPASCQGMGLGPCISYLYYSSVQNNKNVTFSFGDTNDRKLAEQIISTFQFIQSSPSAAPSMNQP